MIGEPPSSEGGFHSSVTESLMMSLASSGPTGLPGKPVHILSTYILCDFQGNTREHLEVLIIIYNITSHHR